VLVDWNEEEVDLLKDDLWLEDEKLDDICWLEDICWLDENDADWEACMDDECPEACMEDKLPPEVN